MNFETLITIIGAFGGLEALKWLAGLRASRRKGDAEVAESVEGAISRRVKTYEESICFLQSQLQDKERQFVELSQKYQESMQRGLELTRQLGEMKLRYRQSRCDRKECPDRKPPFAWLRKTAVAVVAALLMAGSLSCTRNVYVPVERVRIVSDSTVRASASRDTVFRCDSVIVAMRGDTVLKEAWRFRESVSVVRDTVYVERCDTLVEPRIVPVEKKVSSRSRLIPWLLLAVLAVFYISSKVRRRGMRS